MTVISIMGGANIYVPDTVEVEVSGFSLMGGDTEYGAPRPPRPGAPLVRIHSYNLMGAAASTGFLRMREGCRSRKPAA